MDHDTLKQLARLKFTMRQAKLGTLDLERYSTDDAYARRMLDQGEEADNEEIVMLAVELRHKRGLLDTGESQGDSFTDAEGAPARHAEGQDAAAQPEEKQGMMSRMFGRRKPAPSKSKAEGKEDDANAKYMYGPRG